MFTKELYDRLAEAYDFYNNKLFEGRLSPVLLTLQRKRNARGYFCPERFVTRNEETAEIHEIALNPDLFFERTDREILSTLVHEMVHQLQREYGGKDPKRAYHNAEWARMMVEVGLMPSSTGAEGGSKTGPKVSHYIMPGDAFDEVTEQLLASGFTLPIEARLVATPKAAERDKSKTPYVCSACGAKIWAKPGVKVICGDCEIAFEAQI